MGVAIEIDPIQQSSVVAVLNDFHHHVVLENGTSHLVAGQLTGTFDVKQETGKAGVVKIEFWALDKTLGNVLIIGGQEGYQIGGLKNGEPVGDGLVVDA